MPPLQASLKRHRQSLPVSLESSGVWRNVTPQSHRNWYFTDLSPPHNQFNTIRYLLWLCSTPHWLWGGLLDAGTWAGTPPCRAAPHLPS